MPIVFDENKPKRDEGFWGLKIDGEAVSEVVWADRKPSISYFMTIKEAPFEDRPFKGIKKIEVVKVEIVELGQPELLSKNCYDD